MMFYKPRIDDALLGDLSEGLLATSACLGSYSSQLILNGDVAAAERLLDHHAALFPDRFFIELQLHTGPEQTIVNKVLMEIAQRKNLPMIVTNDSHYTRPEDKRLHETSLCMQTGSVMSDPPYNPEIKAANTGVKTRFSFGNIDVHMANHDWMWARAQELGIPYEAISNTIHVAEMVNDQTYFEDKKNRYPRFQKGQNPVPSWDLLEQEVQRRLPERLGADPSQEYIERVRYELSVIKKMGFYDYMLIVQELVAGAKEVGVSVGPGRGSAAGSLISYVLDITQVDPIKHGLVFERFLNYGRAATPMHFDKDMVEAVKAQKKQKCNHNHKKKHVHKLPSNLMKCFNISCCVGN